MLNADHIIDLGPGAGRFGGAIVAQGSPQAVVNNPHSVTGPFMKSTVTDRKFSRRKLPAANSPGGWIQLKGAKANNLQNVNLSIPIGRFTVLSGISGSGKSSLMRGCLFPAVQAGLANPKRPAKKSAKDWK